MSFSTCAGFRTLATAVIATVALVGHASPETSESVTAQGGAASEVNLVALPYGPETCKQGYVWREARPADRVCVTPAERDLVATDNASAAKYREPSGGGYGPNTCKPGYVWREAFGGDVACVSPERRGQVKADNAAAESRRATQSGRGAGGATTGGGIDLKHQQSGVVIKGNERGSIINAAITCSLSGTVYNWRMQGLLNGRSVQLTFSTNSYRGRQGYNVTSVGGDPSGIAELRVDNASYGTTGGTNGIFSIQSGNSRKGSISGTLYRGNGTTVQVNGGWTVPANIPWKC